MSPYSFWHTKQLQFCHIFTPCRPTLCSILHKNGPTTYNEHFTADNSMTLVCAGWLHEVQWVLCTAFWSMVCMLVCLRLCVTSQLSRATLKLGTSPAYCFHGKHGRVICKNSRLPPKTSWQVINLWTRGKVLVPTLYLEGFIRRPKRKLPCSLPTLARVQENCSAQIF